jgi:hypothetical protein
MLAVQRAALHALLGACSRPVTGLPVLLARREGATLRRASYRLPDAAQIKRRRKQPRKPHCGAEASMHARQGPTAAAGVCVGTLAGACSSARDAWSLVPGPRPTLSAGAHTTHMTPATQHTHTHTHTPACTAGLQYNTQPSHSPSHAHGCRHMSRACAMPRHGR